MRSYFKKGGFGLVGKQKNLPEALKKKIMMAKKKKSKKPSPMEQMIRKA